MANPFDFSSGAVLTAAQLNQIGDYESWTPTLTNITLGSGTVTAHYAQVNEFVHFEIEFASASDTSFSSSSMQFSMPVNYGGALDFVGLGNGWVRPQASTIYPVQVIGVQSTNRIVPYYMQNYTSVQVISVRETLPETWTKSSGVLYMAGSYRAA
tara:strand:- start:65 stop:529 length:465 start_codon:yes stop_codon:yes gene_type:complete